ncbi:MAG: PGPGW domain-containing protein, partial [Desulfobacterales bacterium]|nr:PGPGW domain-containing protein [Desulfobacterales bacterium]
TGAMWVDRNVAVRWIMVLAKNLLGYILIAAGILMLVLPGQGILTIVAGIMLLNFPGKYKLERWIVSRRPALQSINWARRRSGKDPLVLEEER